MCHEVLIILKIINLGERQLLEPVEICDQNKKNQRFRSYIFFLIQVDTFTHLIKRKLTKIVVVRMELSFQKYS